MSAASEGRQPELRHRVVAAAGASIVSALLVNPLDIVKTRVQAASLVTDRPVPTCSLTRYPVRWVRSQSLAECKSKMPAVTVSGCVGTAAAHPAGNASPLHRPLLGQLPMSSCACAMKVADLGPGHLVSAERCVNAAPFRPVTVTGMLRDIVRKEGIGALWRGADTAILVSIPMVGVYMPLYDYLLQGAVSSLGPYAPVIAGSVARTLAVLLVGPLELVRTRQQGSADGARTAWGAFKHTLRDTAAVSTKPSAGVAGGNSSASASGGGAVAAAVVVDDQAGAAGHKAAGGRGGPIPAAAQGGGVLGGLGVMRAVPRLWTGVIATLARDVPFSAIYWGLVEQVRGGLLARWRRQALEAQCHALHLQHHAQTHGLAQAQAAALHQRPHQDVTSAAAARTQRGATPCIADAVHAAEVNPGATDPHHHSHHQQHTDNERRQLQPYQQQLAAGHPHPHPSAPLRQLLPSAPSLQSVALSPPASAPPPASEPPQVPAGRAVLAANLIAGSAAGAVAAVVTTPFDVVKTQLQVGDVRSGQTSSDVLRRVLQTEGPAGLFRGWGPRAARTAPACAVVVASYEVLKLLL